MLEGRHLIGGEWIAGEASLPDVSPSDTNDVVGFTILSTGDRAAPTNAAFAALQVGGVTGLYTINLSSGTGSFIGAGSGVALKGAGTALNIAGATINASGNISIGAGSTLNYSGGAFNLNAGTAFAGSGQFNVNGATLAVNSNKGNQDGACIGKKHGVADRVEASQGQSVPHDRLRQR